MNKVEIPFSSRNFFAYEHFNDQNKNVLLLCADEENALTAYRQLLFFEGNDDKLEKVLFLPSLDTVPYDRVSPSNEILSQRAATLTKLAKSNTPKIIVTAAQNLLTKRTFT